MRHPPTIAAYRVGMTADMGTASDAAALVTRLVRVRGRVQGIGYREACVRRARALGVTGWVRNRMDASVEAMLQGSPLQPRRCARGWTKACLPRWSRAWRSSRCRRRFRASTASSNCRPCEARAGAPVPLHGCGWMGSTQYTVCGGSAGVMSRLTTTGSCPLRTITQLRVSVGLALIS